MRHDPFTCDCADCVQEYERLRAEFEEEPEDEEEIHPFDACDQIADLTEAHREFLWAMPGEDQRLERLAEMVREIPKGRSGHACSLEPDGDRLYSVSIRNFARASAGTYSPLLIGGTAVEVLALIEEMHDDWGACGDS